VQNAPFQLGLDKMRILIRSSRKWLSFVVQPLVSVPKPQCKLYICYSHIKTKQCEDMLFNSQ